MNTVLVVDDEPEVSIIFPRLLAEHGYSMHYCSTAEDGLAYLQQNDSIRIVFLDIRLPGMDGITAISKFREARPEIKIIMMTAFQTVESVLNAMKAGAVDFLVKPLDPALIIKAVKTYGAEHAKPARGKGRRAAPPAPAAADEDAADPADSIFIAQTPTMKTLLDMADKFAASDGTVLILGESGTGKEMLAHYIHQKSPRAGKPLITVDCASIPESLFESELFGYEKGAFTGADAPKAGRVEMADGGTLFLDEIGNVPVTMQTKLLRFIEDKKVSRLGGKKHAALDIRLIAATNIDLKNLIERGQFREDLYYRLSSLAIHLPPLRNRPKDEKETLVRHFLQKNARRLGKPEFALSENARQMIFEYPWPGNVRELQNSLYSACLLCGSGHLDVPHFPIGMQSYFSHREQLPVTNALEEDKTLRQILDKVEKEHILSVLKQTGGNKKKASEILDMDYKNLLTKLKKYAQDPPA